MCGTATGQDAAPCLTYHLPAEGRPPAPPKSREGAALLLWTPTGGGVIAKAGGIWAGGALLSWGWGRGRREEEPSGGGPWPPIPLEAPGPAKVKQASASLLLERRQWRLREAWPQGPQSPGVAEHGRGELLTKPQADANGQMWRSCRTQAVAGVGLALGLANLPLSSRPVSPAAP